jgi:hypothetical protein
MDLDAALAYCRAHSIPTAKDEDTGEALFGAAGLGRSIRLINVRNALHAFPVDEVRKLKAPTQGGPQTIVILTAAGVRRLIAPSRSLRAKDAARAFGMESHDRLWIPVEATTLRHLADVFEGRARRQ